MTMRRFRSITLKNGASAPDGGVRMTFESAKGYEISCDGSGWVTISAGDASVCVPMSQVSQARPMADAMARGKELLLERDADAMARQWSRLCAAGLCTNSLEGKPDTQKTCSRKCAGKLRKAAKAR